MMQKIFVILMMSLLASSASHAQTETPKPSTMMVRIAEIEIDPAFLQEYTAILKEESAESIKLEKAVICIFPIFQKEQPNFLKLLEIYESKEAYEKHIKSPHFLKYKTSTLSMVKSLKLVEMSTIDPESMPLIFSKMK